MDTQNKIDAMRQGGKILGKIRNTLISHVKPGIDLFSLEEEAVQLIKQAGAKPNFVPVNNYGFATCLMVNDEVVHCKPRHYTIQDGDLVTVDVGLEWQGWQLDTADSCIAGRKDDRFVKTGRIALQKAINEAVAGKRVGNISQAMQQEVEHHGYSMIRQYCGHGVGRTIHEDPPIFCYLERPITQTPLLKEGMTIAIEVMENEGKPEVVIDRDGWHSHTADGSRSAQFEHTVLVTKHGPEILTLE